MKALIKKAVASVMGAATMCMSLAVPAMATDYDLADYPAPFVNGDTNFLMVVGEDAMAADIAGGIDVAVRLGAENGDEVTCGSDSTSVSGGKDKEIAINEDLSAFGNLDDNDLAGLIDEQITFNDDDYDVHEEIVLNNELVLVSTEQDDDFGSEIAMITDEGSITYSYVFDDPIPTDEIGDENDEDELDITFLGKDITITAVDVADDKITVKSATEYFLMNGEKVEIDGKEITVSGIGETAVRVDVDGVTETIGEDDTEKVNGIKILAKDIFYVDDSDERSVTLEIGESITDQYEAGDALEIFGGSDDNDDALWVWTVVINGDDELTSLGISYNQKSNDPDDDPEPVYMEGVLELPGDYAMIDLDSFTTEDSQEYTLSFDEIELDDDGGTYNGETSDDVWVVVFEGEEDDAFEVTEGTGTESVDTVYLFINGSTSAVWYKDSDGDTAYSDDFDATADAADLFTFTYEDTEFTVDFDFSEMQLVLDITDETSEDKDLLVTLENNALPEGLDNIEEADADDVVYGTTNLGEKDDDYRTQYGIIVQTPEDYAERDEIVLSIPDEQVKVNVIVSGPDTDIIRDEGETVIEAVPITDDIARLDTEVTESMKQNKNLILIGGPAVNMLTAQALGLDYPSYGADSGIPEDAALLQMVNGAFNTGKAALIVAGWEAENTRAACSVLQQFSAYDDLTGTAIVVEGTDTPTLSALE
jgi:hypothetical protein